MSVRFDAAADRLVRTANLPNYDSNYAIVFPFYFPTRPAQGEYRTLFSLNRNDAGEAADTLVLFGQLSTDTRLRIWVQGNGGGGYAELSGATNLSPNTWYIAALVRSANNARTVYLATLTSLFAQEISFTTSYSGRSAPTRMEMGGFGSANYDPFNGRIDGAMLWTETRSLAELQAQQFSLRFPLFFTNLAGYWPMFSGSGERARDYSGLGRDWTEGGTLTDEDAGPFYYPVWPYGGHVTAPASGQSISPSFIASTAQVFAPSLSQQANGSIAPVFIASGSQVYTPTLSVQSNSSIAPNFITGNAQVFTPTLSTQANGSIAPVFIAGGSQVFEPVLSQGGGAQSIVPAFIAGGSQVYSPTVSTQPNGSLAPALVQSQTQVFAPTVSAQSNSSISPAFVAGAAQVFAPTVTQQSNGSIAPAFVASATQVFTPSLSAQANGSITPNSIAGGSQVFTPSLSDGSLQQIVVPFIPGQSVVYQPFLFFGPGYPLVAEVQTVRVVAEVQTVRVGV